MIQEQKRIKLAEACGWKRETVTVGDETASVLMEWKETGWVNPDGVWAGSFLPDYFNDLNSMHEAEKQLTDEQRKNYWKELFFFISPERRYESQPFNSSDIAWLISATATHRAEAFGLTLNLWT